MVVRAKGQIRMNADLASGHVFDQIFDDFKRSTVGCL